MCQELAWRAFYHHTWLHRGEAILHDISPAIAQIDYSATLPTDIRMAATGVPVIDASVRQLYATGYLHNHQRLWLASYIVHLRKVHWRVAADWLYGHLLDGDLASNHLSWQWVAGTFSQKPYLFDAENVAHNAGQYLSRLASPGTAIDRSYEELEAIARTNASVGPEVLQPLPMREPALLVRPTDATSTAEVGAHIHGKDIAVLHPWSLGKRPIANYVVGIIHLPFHTRFPWSALRWNFVMARMRAVCDAIWIGDLNHAHSWLNNARTAHCIDTLNFEYAEALKHSPLQIENPSSALPEPGSACASFSVYLNTLMRHAPELFESNLSQQVARLKNGV